MQLNISSRGAASATQRHRLGSSVTLAGVRADLREKPLARSTVPVRNLVVAIDDIEDMQESCKAVDWTLQHLYKDGDVLHLLHVVPDSRTRLPWPAGLLYQAPLAESGQEQELMTHAHDYIRSSLAYLAQRHHAKCEVDLVQGSCVFSMGDTVIRKCAELDASVVVVATRKQSFIEDIFIPSVGKHVLEHCPRPTLIFHAESKPFFV